MAKTRKLSSLFLKLKRNIFPESLLSRIYKAKYFPTVNFIEATTGYNPSYTWRSLMLGKDLLLAGVRWRVGDGRDIGIFRDPRLPRPSTFLPITKAREGQDDMVEADLITAGRRDDHVLEETFCPIDCESCIRSVPHECSGHADALLCHSDPRGVFTVKSAYKLAMEQKIVDSLSESELVQKWWKALRNCHDPGKIKVFMWRCFNGILPCLTNLAKRGVKVFALLSSLWR
ncbi:hypothetical protein TIFTF001_037503 [Ficus carica]|uniref:Reverse transcriptase zinc-binding domain-containing protein n=1 Tax=Ficus carica TaxID=3494 RepID=A0AA88E5P1_FICCA|nr:hypothetical protein TIFTF001_037483 [Ficus carica]GMN68432.1 hypothetical protein TIFTF001_037491 [Ficus carica]GMN68439.1 hypothetical protein TIFTF001_037495 [Ficus carica]GMN68444.1 hypothetical protein TIFTF001_037503 [Ficus carica]